MVTLTRKGSGQALRFERLRLSCFVAWVIVYFRAAPWGVSICVVFYYSSDDCVIQESSFEG